MQKAYYALSLILQRFHIRHGVHAATTYVAFCKNTLPVLAARHSWLPCCCAAPRVPPYAAAFESS